LFEIPEFEVFYWERDTENDVYGTPVHINIEDCESLTTGQILLLKDLPRLQHVCLNGSNVDDTMIDALLACKQIEVLEINETSVSHEGLIRLAKHPSLYTISAKGLDLSRQQKQWIESTNFNMFWYWE